MAIKPNDGEVFLREVDEELRKERVNQTVTRYGWWIIAGFVLVLAAIGGFFWWQSARAERAQSQGEALLNALDSLESGNRNAATPRIDELAESSIEGYRVAALFARANTQIAANNVAAAVATLGSIAGNEDFAEPYRHAALVRQTALEFDRLPPQQVVQRLAPLARPGQPFFGVAGEMVGVAQLRMNRPDLAGPLFGRIGRDETVPASIRTRAIQMAGSLGINALPDPPPGQVAPAGPAAPAATAPQVPAAPPAPSAGQGNRQ
ncbi:MAG: tetratricopeptide repeat protein [Sphingomonas sp.]